MSKKNKAAKYKRTHDYYAQDEKERLAKLARKNETRLMNRALKAQGLPSVDPNKVKRQMAKKQKVAPVNALREKNARKMRRMLKKLSIGEEKESKPKNKKERVFKGDDSSSEDSEGPAAKE